MKVELAIAQAMTERAHELRRVYRETEAMHGRKPSWNVTGHYDRMLAKRYARVLAPRVAELLAGVE